MHLPAKLKMLIGLGLALTGGKSLAQQRTDITPLHKIVMVNGDQVKLGHEFAANTFDVMKPDGDPGHYHFTFQSQDRQTVADLDIQDTNHDGVYNKLDEYELRVRKQEGDVRREYVLQHGEGYVQAFEFRNGQEQSVFTVFEGAPVRSEAEGAKTIKTKINRHFPGLK